MNNVGRAIHIKKEILVRIIKAFLSDDFEEQARLIPYDMRPKGMEVPYRCCVYKERAIIKNRVIAGLGFSIEDDDETASLAKYAKRANERTEIDSKHLTVLQSALWADESALIFLKYSIMQSIPIALKTELRLLQYFIWHWLYISSVTVEPINLR